MELSKGKNFYVYCADYDDETGPTWAIAEDLEEICAEDETIVYTARITAENRLRITRELE